MKVYKNS